MTTQPQPRPRQPQPPTITRYEPPPWDEDLSGEPATSLARRREHNFVTPASTPAQWQPPQLARGDQVISLDVAPRATVTEIVRGDQVSQAKSFLLYAAPLCAAFGLVVLLLFAIATPLIAGGLGWALLKALAVYFGAFLAAYIFLLERHLKHSPAGVALKESDNAFDFLRTEQAHRHEVENTLLNKYLEDSKR